MPVPQGNPSKGTNAALLFTTWEGKALAKFEVHETLHTSGSDPTVDLFWSQRLFQNGQIETEGSKCIRKRRKKPPSSIDYR